MRRPKKNQYYFIKLSLIIVGVFILQIFIPSFTESFHLNEKAISNYEIWRFFTAIFLHASLIHLLYNLFALLFFGFALERLIGSRRFLIVFIFSGLIANIISVNFYSNSLGASGAIMGIIGTLTVIRPLMMVWAFGLIMPIFIASLLWIIGDILGIFFPTGIGNIAHLSGMGVGFLIGFLLRKLHHERRNRIEIPESYIREWEKTYIKER